MVPDLARVQERAWTLSGEIGPGDCVAGRLPAGQGGLAAIDVNLDVAPSAREPLRLTLWREENGGAPVRTAWAQPTGTGFTRFAFDALPGGEALTLCLDAAASSGAKVWHSGDVEAALALRPYRTSGPLTAMVDAWASLSRWPWGVVATLALLVAPGLALAAMLERRLDVVLAAAPGLSVLGIALGWWVAGLAGLTFTSAVLSAAVAIAAAISALRFSQRGWSGVADAGWLALLWLIALTARLAPVRDLALPAWVDGVHHAYLTDLLASAGRLPADFGPLLEISPFSYHFGFHALAASAALLSGASSADAVIIAGQLLGAAAGPAAYLLARLYGGSPRAGLAAGAAATLVSVMPGYYVSWSRFTQLAGLVALPVVVLLFHRARAYPHMGLAAGASAAGLLLTHPRVALLTGALIAAEQIVWRRGWRGLALSSAAGLVVAGPWLLRLAGSLVPRLGAAGGTAGDANTLDLSAIQTAYDPVFYGLAVAALVGGLAAGSRPARIAALWMGLALVIANPAVLGLPGTYMVSNGAVIIALWLPAAALLGCLIAWLGNAAARWIPTRLPLTHLAAPTILLVGLALGRPSLEALNPTTVLATAADRRALEGASRVLPADARVAVHVREWQLATYMGDDAGYWVGVATPGRAIVPPLLYGLGPADAARAITERLRVWETAQAGPDELTGTMTQHGVDWLFVGERGPPAPPGLSPVVIEGRAGLYRLR